MLLFVCFSIKYGRMFWPYLIFSGYGELLVLDGSLTVLLVSADIIEIALCVVVLSELNDDDDVVGCDE